MIRRWIRDALGARVSPGRAETGVHDVFRTGAARRDRLFGKLPRRLDVFSWHGDSSELPPGAVPPAGSLACTR